MSNQVADPSAQLPEDAEIPHVTRWQRIALGSTTSIFLILVAMVVVFSVLHYEEFATVDNIRNLCTDASVLLVISVGMTFVIITAGIDLSVGAVLVFSGVIAARMMHAVGGNGWGTIVVGLIASLVAGSPGARSTAR